MCVCLAIISNKQLFVKSIQNKKNIILPSLNFFLVFFIFCFGSHFWPTSFSFSLNVFLHFVKCRSTVNTFLPFLLLFLFTVEGWFLQIKNSRLVFVSHCPSYISHHSLRNKVVSRRSQIQFPTALVCREGVFLFSSERILFHLSLSAIWKCMLTYSWDGCPTQCLPSFLNLQCGVLHWFGKRFQQLLFPSLLLTALFCSLNFIFNLKQPAALRYWYYVLLLSPPHPCPAPPTLLQFLVLKISIEISVSLWSTC